MLETSLRATLLCALGACLITATPSHARADEVEGVSYRFDISDQTLSQALRTYAQVSGQEIIFTEDLFEGMKPISLKGSYTAAEALDKLLKGTGLVHERSPSGAITIKRANQGARQGSIPAAANAASVESSAPGSSAAESGSKAMSDNRGQGERALPPLEEIVVTASRREENLQRESRQVSALTAAELSRNGVSNAETFANLVPGVSVASAGAHLQFYIRGVGDRTANAFGDPAVASSLDGVYIPRSFALAGLFFDLERIEVVKGPQGTLYGRNASAGAVNIITAKPSHEFGAFVETEIGNYDAVRVTGAATGGIGEVAALRLSGQIRKRDGYLSDGLNDEDFKAGRVQALLEPTPDLSFLVSFTAFDQGGSGGGPVLKPPPGDDPFVGAADPRSLPVFDAFNPANTSFRPGTDAFLDNDTRALTGQFDWRLKDATLTVVPGYVHTQVGSLTYSSGVPYLSFQESKQRSIEARLSSNDSTALSWVLGAFGAREDASEDLTATVSRTASTHRVVPEVDDTTWAVFGEGKLGLRDDLRVLAGLRYTSEKKAVSGTSQTRAGTNLPPAAPFFGERDFDALNYRLGVEYDAAEAVMLSATVSTGFKAGGFYGALPPNSYDPEKLTSYELGLRSRLFDGRVQVNVDAFYWDYTDRQESFGGIVTGGGTALITTNAGAATLHGADASVSARVTGNGLLSVDLSYLHSEYDDYAYNTNTSAQRTACRLGPSTDPRLAVSVDCSGFQLVRAPTWTGRVAYQHTIPLADRGDLQVTAQSRFSSPYWLANDFLPAQRTNDYTVSDFIVTYVAPNNRFELGAFVRNIEDTAVYTSAAQPTPFNGMVFATIQLPRTYGVRGRLNF